MINKIKDIIDNIIDIFITPEWKKPDFDFDNYPFYYEFLNKKIDYGNLLPKEDKLKIFKVGLRAKKRKTTFILYYEYEKKDFNAYAASRDLFIPKPKLVLCELCSHDNLNRAFIYKSQVDYAFTKKP